MTPEQEVQMLRDQHVDWMARVSALLTLLDDLGHGHHGCNIVERVTSENWHGKTEDEKQLLIASLHPDKAGIVIWGGGGNPKQGFVVSRAAFDAIDAMTARPDPPPAPD